MLKAMTRESIERALIGRVKDLGYNVPNNAIVNRCGNVEFFDECDTWWEVNPKTGMSRHCGIEPGSFWTEWSRN